MQIYGENNADEHSVEMMFSYKELKELVIALSEFEHQIAQYKKDNSGKADLGFAHLHFKDCGEISKRSKNDAVFLCQFERITSALPIKNITGDGLGSALAE